MKYDQYATLAISHSVPDHLVRPETQPQASRLTLSSPALSVLHDFQQHPPATLLDKLSVEKALELFKSLQLRYLLVENTNTSFQGILSAADVLGPNLMAQMQLHHLLPGEMQVRDLMVPRSELWTVPYASVCKAKVGDVLHTLEMSGQLYLCVHDFPSQSDSELRGLFCARDIAERLGDRWTPALWSRSFSQLRSTLLGKGELAS